MEVDVYEQKETCDHVGSSRVVEGNKAECKMSIGPNVLTSSQGNITSVVTTDRQVSGDHSRPDKSVQQPEEMKLTQATLGQEISPTITSQKELYLYKDSGPYLVILRAQEGLISNIHPLKLGKILFDYNIPNIHVVKPAGKAKFEIHFKTYLDANRFLSSDFDNKYNCNTFIPTYHIHVKGILKNVAVEVTEEEIRQHSMCSENYSIKSVIRFNKKCQNESGEIEWRPSTTVMVTFRAQRLPKEIKLFYMVYSVHKYNSTVLQCRQCWKYGHTKKFCRNDVKCLKCAGSHQIQNCTEETATCGNCTLAHKANSADCPKYKIELAIIKKIDELKISRYDAIAIHQGKKTFTEIVAQQTLVKDSIGEAFPRLSPEREYTKEQPQDVHRPSQRSTTTQKWGGHPQKRRYEAQQSTPLKLVQRKNFSIVDIFQLDTDLFTNLVTLRKYIAMLYDGRAVYNVQELGLFDQGEALFHRGQLELVQLELIPMIFSNFDNGNDICYQVQQWASMESSASRTSGRLLKIIHC
ncbi:uncharacterized protein [Periplaneta americana]|uniref:uncharacterized protein isoform X2 n=1 Tax=Periplaneta americana TaxID=6978 RepID=UPI0037E757A4